MRVRHLAFGGRLRLSLLLVGILLVINAVVGNDITTQKAPPDDCVRLQVRDMGGEDGPKPVLTGKLLKLTFRVTNPSARKTGAPYTYVLRVDIPPKVTYVEAYSMPKMRDGNFAPVVGDNKLVWEMVNIPGNLPKVTFGVTFRVNNCANTPLQFKAMGFRDINDEAQCETRLILTPIPVVRDAMVDCSTAAPSTNPLPPGVPIYQVYGPPDTRCIESGIKADIVNPTLDEVRN